MRIEKERVERNREYRRSASRDRKSREGVQEEKGRVENECE